MKKYICTVCGYIFDENDGVLWENLPDNWICPLCGAGKSAFELQVEKPVEKDRQVKVNDQERAIQAYEMAALCSNLAKGSGKQYLEEESQAFLELEEYFSRKYQEEENTDMDTMVKEVDDEIKTTFKKANAIVDLNKDRGAKRSLVWSEKVTRMLKSVVTRYEEEGDKYLEDTKVYVCEICGFIYVGDELPKVCPVCKVPNFKMKEIGRD